MAGVGTRKPAGPPPVEDTRGGSFDNEDVAYGEFDDNPYVPRAAGLLGERNPQLSALGEPLDKNWRGMTTPPSRYDPPGTQEEYDLQRLGPNNGAASSTFSPLDAIGYGVRAPAHLLGAIGRQMFKGYTERQAGRAEQARAAETAKMDAYRAERQAQQAAEAAYKANRERENMTNHLAELWSKYGGPTAERSFKEMADKHGVALDEVRRRAGAMNATP